MMTEEEIILQIEKVEIEKLKKSEKKVDHIKLISEKNIGTDQEELCHIVAKLKDEKVEFFYKTWDCDMRGMGGPYESNVKYVSIDLLNDLKLEELNQLLEDAKSRDDVL